MWGPRGRLDLIKETQNCVYLIPPNITTYCSRLKKFYQTVNGNLYNQGLEMIMEKTSLKLSDNEFYILTS